MNPHPSPTGSAPKLISNSESIFNLEWLAVGKVLSFCQDGTLVKGIANCQDGTLCNNSVR